VIGYLWRNRERPRWFSHRWWIVWAKRAFNAPSLAAVAFRRRRLAWKGGRIGEMSYLSTMDINGPAKNLVVGNHAFIGRNVHVATHALVRIGDRAVINDRVAILTASHDVSDPAWKSVRAPIVIGEYAWIATGAIILPGVTVGRGAVVGAGAVVARDVPAFSIVAGNPARVSVRKRTETLNYDPVALAAPIEAWLMRSDRGGEG